MNLYIETKDGQPVNHPAFEDNLIEAFGAVPELWELFIRVEQPTPGVYEVLEDGDPTYQKIDGVWKDVWPLRAMTAEEKTAKQQSTISAFNNRNYAENWAAWTLDEATCTMIPPISRPAPDESKLVQGIMTFWCGAESCWKDAPVRPEGNFKFDFLAWTWISAS